MRLLVLHDGCADILQHEQRTLGSYFRPRPGRTLFPQHTLWPIAQGGAAGSQQLNMGKLAAAAGRPSTRGLGF
jgi:hypothetical protein